MAANTELLRVRSAGWRTGLANLLHKENRAWWASRRWLVQSVLWTVVVNGLVALLVFVLLPYARAMHPSVESLDSLTTGADLLFKIGLQALAFGTIVLVQDAIIGERQLGVTEWLLSKPLSRPAYVLSKLFAHGVGVLVILVGLQGALGYGLLSLIVGQPYPLPAYLVGMAGLAVHTLFYLALTLMMGVVTTNRRTLLGASQGVLLGGALIAYNVPSTAALLTPWGLLHVLPATVLGLPLPLSAWLPIGVTAVLSVIFVAVTLIRFERVEF